jgi:hypothetical protein
VYLYKKTKVVLFSKFKKKKNQRESAENTKIINVMDHLFILVFFFKKKKKNLLTLILKVT